MIALPTGGRFTTFQNLLSKTLAISFQKKNSTLWKHGKSQLRGKYNKHLSRKIIIISRQKQRRIKTKGKEQPKQNSTSNRKKKPIHKQCYALSSSGYTIYDQPVNSKVRKKISEQKKVLSTKKNVNVACKRGTNG